MPDWTPTDPRQVSTYRLLQLIGGEPAAYFLDASRLMDGDLKFEATTHLVGHLLRELDGSLSGVLRPMVPPERWPPPNTKNSQRLKIDAICDALRIPSNDDFRKGWRDYATGLHRRAHRQGLASPRPVDRGFRELWEQGQTVIQSLAQRIEANFTATLPLIDDLAAGQPNVSALRHNVPHSTVALDRFFEQAGVAWLEPLRKAGYFDNPPPLIYRDDGTVAYSRWPQGRYLVRVAAEDAETVISLGLELETDNSEAHESFVDAACAMPAKMAARLVPAIERWLETPFQWALPFKVRDLAVHLISNGEVDSGLLLVRTLFKREDSRDQHLDGEFVGKLTWEIFPASGISGLEILLESLAELVAAESYGKQDHSYIWRPYVDGDRRQDLRDHLVTAVRDAAEALVAEDEDKLREVVVLLEAHDWSIFRRLALALLTKHPDAELIAARLTDPDLFEDPAYDREYTALAPEHFHDLSPEDQATILGWIEAASGYQDDEQSRRRWQRYALARLGRPLPGEWEERYRELGGDEEEEPEPLPEGGFVGPRSPIGTAELEAMSVEEVVAFLEEWKPENGWLAPSPEGLSRVLREVVSANPERFAAEAMLFVDLDPTYVRAVLGGLHEANRNERVFPWKAVLQLANAIFDRPRVIAGRDPRGLGGIDPGWVWTWQESLHLVRDGLHRGEGQIPLEHRELVWNMIEVHAEDPNPSAEEEKDDEGFGPATQALNSVRGAAMHAAFGYGWWIRGEGPQEKPRLPEELAKLLEPRLDPGTERAAAIRSVYGQWFPTLVACDEAWAAAHVGLIFPLEGEDPLSRAAWHAYLRFNRAYSGVYALLGAQYRRGIEELEGREGEDDLLGEVGEGLVAHLMTLYLQGVIAFDDESGLLNRFYEIASVERRAQALESIGRGLRNGEQLSDEVSTRLRTLFERRVETVHTGADGEELRGYAWWFASGKFDAVWSLTQLRALLEAGGRVHPDHVVAEHLATLRADHLLEVVRVLELLIETGTRQWFVIGAREPIAAILIDALSAGGEPETRARDIVNRLVARGHGDFERLLPV